MKKKKVLFALGGTGGHIFPAAALAEELLENGVECVFAGEGLHRNKYFRLLEFCGHEVAAAPLFSWQFPLRFIKGLYQGVRLLHREKADLVIGFGSYYSFSLLAAALLGRTRIVLFEPNAFPGKVHRFFSPYAERHFIALPGAACGRGSFVLIDPPMRPSFKRPLSSQEARNLLGLNTEMATLLVFGGSQGASFINGIMKQALPPSPPFQIYHIAGNDREKENLQTFYEKKNILAKVTSFETRMHLAWRAADLAITRGGASTLQEAIFMEVPLFIIPLTCAAENHQTANAKAFTSLFPHSRVFYEKEVSPQQLQEALTRFFFFMSHKREERKEAYCYFKASRNKPLSQAILELL